MTYDFMQPYLKGFHLSADAWRPNRDAAGWRTTGRSKEPTSTTDGAESCVDSDDQDDPGDFMLAEGLFTPTASAGSDSGSPPKWVKPVPLLKSDVAVLQRFFAEDTPLQVLVRPVEGAIYVAYGAGDASGEGFGSRVKPLGLQPLLRRGFWCTEASEESSNWRELRNLVDAIKEESVRGRLVGREIWLATDNTTAATAYYKGSSSATSSSTFSTLQGLE